MADLFDIETALANLIGGVIYPGGIGQANTTGIDCKIFAGWPNESELATTLAAGIAEISIYSGQNLERVTTRYARSWYDIQAGTPTLTVSVSANAITIGGVVTAANYITLVIDGAAYSYAAVGGDTISTIATALAALIPSALVVSVVGPVINLIAKTAGRITASVNAPVTVGREVGRQQRGMMVTIWAPSPQTRAAIATQLMATLQGTDFITLADNSKAWLSYRQSNESDGKENAMAYRRDIQLWAEYATVQTATAYPISAPVITQTLTPYYPPTAAPNAPTGAVIEVLAASVSGGNALVDNDAAELQLQARVNLAAGMAAHVDLVTGQFVAADKSAYATASIAGLMAAAVTAGFAGVVTREQLTLQDWTLATGSSVLVAGANYFLGTGGQITTIVPTSGFLVYVGIAKNTNTLLLDLQPPVQF